MNIFYNVAFINNLTMTIMKKSKSTRSCFIKYDLKITYGCELWCVVVHIKNLNIYCPEVHIWNCSLVTCHDNKLRCNKSIHWKQISSGNVLILVMKWAPCS